MWLERLILILVKGSENSRKLICLVWSDSVWSVLNKKLKHERRKIMQEIYHGSPKSAISSPHTSCEIIHRSIQLSETSE